MRRKLKLFMVSMAVAISLFACYYLLNRDAQPSSSTISSNGLIVPRVPMPSTSQDGVFVRGMGLLEAKEVWFDQRDENGELRFQFRTARADPQGKTITLLGRPEIRIFGRDGQIIDLRGDTGRVEHDNLGPNQAKWKHVELFGNVEIEVDRQGQLTDVPLTQRPADRIQVNLEELRFDQELATIRSNGQVDFYSREADVFGNGLKITLNELNREIEKLTIHQGRRMIVRGAGKVLARSGPMQVAEPRAEAADPPEESQHAIEKIGEVHTYKTTFRDNVKIVQGEFVITADNLDLLYDIFSERDIPRADPDEDTGLAEADPTIDEVGPDAESGDDEMTITWSGQLVMVPHRKTESMGPKHSGRRFEVTATGERVVIASDQGEAVCQTLVYKDPEGQGYLSGKDGQQVRLLNADGTEMIGSLLQFNQAGVVKMKGPGRIASAPAAERESGIPVDEVHFSEHARFHFASLGGSGKRYLDHARFNGNVSMATPTGRLIADIIDVRFTQSSEGLHSIPEQVEALGVRQLATLSRGKDRLQARRFSLMLAQDRLGQPRPQLLNAEGEVLARQAHQSIVANSMLFTFSSLPSETNSETEKSLADVVLIEATGGVEFNDPQRELTAKGDRMVSFPQRRTAYVQGTGSERPALVVTRDGNQLVGLRIDMDQAGERVTITGPGSARYQSERQLDGTASAEPVPIDVSWSDSMSYDGRRSQIRLIGDVKAVSQKNQLTGNVMRLQFDRRGRPTEGAVEAPDKVEAAPFVERFVSKIVVSDRARLLVVDETASTDQGLSSRAYLASEEIIIDMAEQRLEVPVAGKLLLEDYRPASAQSTGQSSGLTGDNMADALKPSVTCVDWGRQMVFYYGKGRHLFDGNVELRRWTADSASLIIQALQNLQGKGAQFEGVLQSVLVSQRLELVYQQDESAGRSRYLGGLAQLNASGGARLHDVRASIEAERIGFLAEKGLYTARGSASQTAHLQWYDEKNGQYASLDAMTIRYSSHKGEYQLEGFRGRAQASTK